MFRVSKESLVQQEFKASKGSKVFRVSKASKESLVQLEFKASKEDKVFKAQLAPRDQQFGLLWLLEI